MTLAEGKVQEARREAMAEALTYDEGEVDLLSAARHIFGDMLADPAAVDRAIAERDAAIDRVSEAAPHAFKVGTMEVIEALALTRDEFTTDAIWALNERRGIEAPPEPRVMGALLKRAAEAGWIEPTDRTVQSGRAENHRRPVRVWRSRIKGARVP
jgi:hypothetical protein